MVVFRSLLVPLKAVIMNLLSIGAAYGIMVALFQWGWLSDLTGVQPGPIEPWMPMMLFAIVFGLSMDYEVFLLSRVREEWHRTGDSRTSVADGLAATAKVITAAAAIMVVVFGSFMLENDRTFKLMGTGLAVGDLPRRHHRPHAARARHHGAAGRPELVAAAVARPAPPPRRRGGHQRGRPPRRRAGGEGPAGRLRERRARQQGYGPSVSAGSVQVGSHVGAWWRGRFGRRLLLEIALLFSLLTLYRLGRYLGRNNIDEAFDHARDVLRWERYVGLANEERLQDLLLDHLPVIKLLNRYYAMVHFPATVAFIALVYVRTPDLYRRIRFVFVSVTGVALATQILYPLAPPRMMAGFVDTIARYGPAIYSRPGVASVANQYAAMPSLHVGWALIVAYGMWQMTRAPVALDRGRPRRDHVVRGGGHRQPLLARRARRPRDGGGRGPIPGPAPGSRRAGPVVA